MGDIPPQPSIDIGGDVGGNVVLGSGNLLTQNINSRLLDLSALPSGAIRALDVMTGVQALKMLRGVEGLRRAVTREIKAVQGLCQLCGHHPLALDLVARRLLLGAPVGFGRQLAQFRQLLLVIVEQYPYGFI